MVCFRYFNDLRVICAGVLTFKLGAMILSIMTFSIAILSIKVLFATFSIMPLSITKL
jgi:hypothetical protein